jgi:steroid delta-isomerase
LPAVAGVVALLASVSSAAEMPERAIRAALLAWTADFNAGRADRVCGLFAPELRYDYRGLPERDYRTLCDLLQGALSRRDKKFVYALAIKEILVSGDLAVARLVWTLTLTDTATGRQTVSREPGLDVFRRQADGSWRIIRYLAYEE